MLSRWGEGFAVSSPNGIGARDGVKGQASSLLREISQEFPMKFATRAIHAGQEADPTTGSTIPPIHLSTTYTQAAPGQHKGYEYSRTQNPTRKALEQCLASLEEGEECAAFASGLAATTTIFQTLEPGDGVVAGHDLYGGTFRLLERLFRRWGLEVTFATDSSSQSYKKAIHSLTRPRLLWLESPTNPLLDVVDISALTQLAKGREMRVVVDNTFATPYLQKPLQLGADLVVHSTTKYLGGHSDVVGGATSDLLSGVHVRLLPSAISPTLRSGGPSGDTRYTKTFPPEPSRRNAMDRPSGDQAGLESACGAVVRRNSMSLT
jgi:Cys/Met metabolism PLP-dependent enzyme